MLGLDDYGSDGASDGSDTSPKVTKKPASKVVPVKAKSSLMSALPPPTTKSSIALPPPTKAQSPGLSLPAPKTQAKRKGPVKITVEALKPMEDGDDEADTRQTKKRRLDDEDGERKGAGASALLAMLPAPKKVNVEVKPPPPKALGAAGSGHDAGVAAPIVEEPADAADGPDLSFLPANLRKPRTKPAPSLTRNGIGNISMAPPPVTQPPPEDDGEDFFSLGPKSTSAAGSSSASTSRSGPSFSAAPQVKEYEPPPPTRFDAYPGYYQKPSGEWAAYDPAFYKKHWDTWQEEYEQSKSGRDGKGWEGADSEDMESVDALAELKKAQLAERERMKSLTAAPKVAAPPPPKLQQKAGTVARSRHQLSTLLADAFQNREMIEERLAEGRRNRKEAGNKYGFF